MAEGWRIRTDSRNRNAKARVAAIAGRQFGRVRGDQLSVGRTTIARWVADGYLHRELPGVYAVGHAARTTESKLSAAVLYAGHGAALSHGTAAWWWGLLNYQPRLIHVSTPKRRKSRAGIRVHDRRQLERIPHNGLPVTTVEQSLLDFAVDAERDLLRFALANADYHGLLNVAALQMICRSGVPGSASLSSALEVHRPELAYARSKGERELIELCESHGLPLPKLNVYRHGWLVDAIWDAHRLVVELDGYGGHRSRAQLESDHQRDLEFRAAGYVVLRYTRRQLVATPDAVAADLGRYLGD